MSLAEKLRARAREIAAAGLAGPAEEQELQRRLLDALADNPSFEDATLKAYVAAAAACGSGDGVGLGGAWYSSIAAKLHDLATDAVAAGPVTRRDGRADRQCPD
jgi:hypothetical protein